MTNLKHESTVNLTIRSFYGQHCGGFAFRIIQCVCLEISHTAPAARRIEASVVGCINKQLVLGKIKYILLSPHNIISPSSLYNHAQFL